MNTQWFVIHTLAGQEQKVKENIEKRIKAEEMADFIKEVLVPMEKVAEVRGGKKTVTTRKLHPGYVYIDVALLDDNRRILDKPWYFIRETPGIIGFVGGERPVAVTPDEIAVIKAQVSESEDSERPKVNFEVGETVKTNDGKMICKDLPQAQWSTLPTEVRSPLNTVHVSVKGGTEQISVES